MVKDAILLPPNAARGAGPAAGAIALALVVLLAVKTWHPRHDGPGAVVSDSLIAAAGGGASSFIDGSSPQSAQPHRDAVALGAAPRARWVAPAPARARSSRWQAEVVAKRTAEDSHSSSGPQRRHIYLACW